MLDEFVKASSGNVSDKFWRSAVTLIGGSGMPGAPISGWLQTFFPYALSAHGEYRRNHGLENYKEDKTCSERPPSRGEMEDPSGMDLADIPSGVATAPFKLTHIVTGQQWNMKYCGGLVGVSQNRTDGALEVCVSWAVVEDTGPLIPKYSYRIDK